MKASGAIADGVLWTPAQITTALWLDAADPSTITQSGGSVSLWNDKSGNSRHVGQVTAAKQPTYSATGLNSRPAIDFDGTSDVLKNASFQPAGALSCFVVLNRDSAQGSIVNIQRAGGVFELAGSFGGGYTNITITATGFMDPALGFNIAASGVSQDMILGLQYDGNGSAASDFVARLNGASQIIVNSGIVGFATETGFSVGGRPVQDLAYYNGRISEIVFIQNQVAISDVEKLEGYLAHKWGLAANLPSGHPYKNAAPTI